MGASPHVACIIVNWNGWKDTLQCLESFSRNRYENLSLIVIDNGSTNDSVLQIRAAFPNLELIESPTNLGFGAGNNLGIRRALERGAEYVWLLNNDTVIEPNTLSELVATAEARCTLGAVGSVLHYFHSPTQVQAWGGGHVNLWAGISHHFHEPVPFKEIDYLTAASLLIRSTVLRQVGLFDEGFFMYWEDTDICFRIRQAGWELGVAERAIVLHKEGASIGAKSSYFDRLVTVSGITFLRRYSRLPLVSLAVFIGGRALKRLASGDAKASKAILGTLWHK